ncbi:hypothetical protein HMPREF1624_06538 [Sporothrix schenckii ATCC 58251]|uniref:Rab-GAP TBC domain-containing protein n=1 Tax=Sporothrix schenckii (strain ATCC 58251 / de Perez 2211183) TaxID=1391915 RepID=U7PNP3_SPOS1|nr:hypothetical protein HMPREF1624_06538 [Sporothrix schenckii ATCC 58251]
MRTLDESRKRWEETQKDGGDLPALQRAVKFNGPSSPCEAGCRSVCWKTFLLFRDEDSATDGSLILREAREDYEAMRGSYMRFIKHPEQLAELTVDPLADDPESPWDTFRRDELVRAEILQDVQRLPDDPFYHQEEIQMLILDVLFVYCKENPGAGGYRQGMHELLAPLVYVLHEDAIESNSLEEASAAEDADMIEMLDGCFIEHDAYALFVKVMSQARAFYEMSSTHSAAGKTGTHETGMTGDPFSPLPTSSTILADGAEESAIVELSKEIHEGTLMKVDPELAIHLKNIEILPQIFLIRWIRLLFGREFPFKQHLILWDSIFAFDPKLHLVPLISVAMLLRIRWKLLEADYSVALQSLLKYPAPQPPHGPHTFVDDAVYLRDHLDAAGGSNLILKYTGRTPSRIFSPLGSSPASSSRPTTPAAAFAAGLGSIRSRTLKVARSPLRVSRHGSNSGSGSAEGLGLAAGGDGTSQSPSSSRLFQGREGMEALFQGAAKGVLERGEKLGINRAVRDAVGEIKRNMAQSYQDARQAAAMNRVPGGDGKGIASLFSPTPDGKRISYGQAMRIMTELEQRNQQLAKMLDETVTTLKTVARAAPPKPAAGVPGEEKNETDKAVAWEEQEQQWQKWLEEVELAAAKVQFVKVHLEDSTLSLPVDEPQSNSPTEGTTEDTTTSVSEKEASPEHGVTAASTESKSPAADTSAAPRTPLLQSMAPENDCEPVTPLAQTEVPSADDDADHMDVDVESSGLKGPEDEKAPTLPTRPPKSEVVEAPPSQPLQQSQPKQPTPPPADQQQPHTIPTRSTLAQSSFSWMLEPGDTASSLANNNGGGHHDDGARSSSPPKKPPRPNAASRTRHAFLFGEVINQSPLGGSGDDDPLADTNMDGSSDGRPRPVTTDEIFGLEPLRRALPKKDGE